MECSCRGESSRPSRRRLSLKTFYPNPLSWSGRGRLLLQIATWNINSIRARKERVLAWVTAQQPDVLCLQETKVTDDTFPRADFEALGYHVATSGQRTYNGVAILSRTPPGEVSRAFADGEDEQEARFLTASIAGVRVVCVYVPNGQVVGGEKFAYKLS